jgi:hypothetical protein
MTESTFVVTNLRPLRRGASLQGFFKLGLPSGMVINNCTYHQRDDGARWVGLPARKYETALGATVWAQIIEFTDKDARTDSRSWPAKPWIATWKRTR